jgi:hypothetical protein
VCRGTSGLGSVVAHPRAAIVQYRNSKPHHVRCVNVGFGPSGGRWAIQGLIGASTVHSMVQGVHPMDQGEYPMRNEAASRRAPKMVR